MTTFINLRLEGIPPKSIVRKHVLYSFLWIIGIFTVILRVDIGYVFPNSEYSHIFSKVVPLVYFVALIAIFYRTKWYFILAFLFYPILMLFWFFPKAILRRGKVYLLINYCEIIIRQLKSLKKSLLYTALLLLSLFLFTVSNSISTEIMSLLVFSFFYYRYVLRYVKSIFNTSPLITQNISDKIDELSQSPDSSYDFIRDFEDKRSDKKQNEEKRRKNRIQRLLTLKIIFEQLGNSLGGFKPKRAYVIAISFKLFLFLLISLIFFTSINIGIYHIDPQNFIVHGIPNGFEFFYYTIKTIVFSNIDLILPSSTLAKTIEILSFLTIGVFLLVLVTSIIYSLKQESTSSNLQKAEVVCRIQNDLVENYIIKNYDTDSKSLMVESEYQEYADWIRKFLKAIF